MYFFSVIIPTYNNLIFLKKAIKSLENQTFKDFETILVDDGSNDGTKKFFLNNYNKNLINLKFFCIARSGGPAKPRNVGIVKSKGKWLCFLDSDDFWSYNKLEVVKNYIDKKKYDLFYHKEFCNNKIINDKVYNSDIYNKLIFKGNICSTSATIVNKKFILKNKILFREDCRYISVEDYDFWLMIALKGGTFKHINKVLGHYRIHKNNLTKNIFKHNRNYLRLIYNHVFNYQDTTFNKKKIFRIILIINKIQLFTLKNNNLNVFFILFYKLLSKILKNFLYLKLNIKKYSKKYEI
jgi:glycosyltransferase involved in cell wall biosynthesis